MSSVAALGMNDELILSRILQAAGCALVRDEQGVASVKSLGAIAAMTKASPLVSDGLLSRFVQGDCVSHVTGSVCRKISGQRSANPIAPNFISQARGRELFAALRRDSGVFE